MRQKQTFILLGVIVAVLILGVAYAAIQNVTLSVAGNVTASPDQGNFKVAFTKAEASGSGSSTQSLTGETTAIMNVYGLTSVGDTRTVVFTIANTSTDITAYLSNTVNHNNTEYFEVTATLGTTTLAPVNGTTTLSITVELIKTPITGPVSDTITASIEASPTPIENTELISFTIEDTVYYAEGGMTWEEWVDSEYNTEGYSYDTLLMKELPEYVDTDGDGVDDYLSYYDALLSYIWYSEYGEHEIRRVVLDGEIKASEAYFYDTGDYSWIE